MGKIPCYFVLSLFGIDGRYGFVDSIDSKIIKKFEKFLHSFSFGKNIPFKYLVLRIERNEPVKVNYSFDSAGIKLETQEHAFIHGNQISNFMARRNPHVVSSFGSMRNHNLIVVPIYFENEQEWEQVLQKMTKEKYIDDQNRNIEFFEDEAFVVIDLIHSPRRFGGGKVILQELYNKGSKIASKVDTLKLSATGEFEVKFK